MTFGIQSGGQYELPSAQNALNAGFPTQFDSLLSWKSSSGNPEPCELQLEMDMGAVDKVFPPNSIPTLLAGAYSGGATGRLTGFGAGVLKIEMGDVMPRTIYSDIRKGRWQLGAQSTVTISLCLWGTFASWPTGLRMRANIAPASPGGEPLRFTVPGALTAPGSVHIIYVPPGATKCDVHPYQNDVGTQGKFALDGCATATRDFVNGVFYPPWSPLPLTAPGYTTLGAFTGNVNFVQVTKTSADLDTDQYMLSFLVE